MVPYPTSVPCNCSQFTIVKWIPTDILYTAGLILFEYACEQRKHKYWRIINSHCIHEVPVHDVKADGTPSGCKQDTCRIITTKQLI
jgi:hypothetical protein